jgi:hypothetical protein
MKRALITIASVGILAATAGVVANAQYSSPSPPRGYSPQPSPTYGPWEWYAGPGPSKRGNECVTHVDINRGYGFRGPCPAPKGAQKGAPKRAAAR